MGRTSVASLIEIDGEGLSKSNLAIDATATRIYAQLRQNET